MLKGNAVIGQSGGPTSVINSSLAGVVTAAKDAGCIENIYGMRFGIEGLMDENLIDLGKEVEPTIEGLKTTPSSALGSCRHKLQEEDLPKVLDVLQRYNIRYFFLIGGNDTMDTIHRVEKYAVEKGYDLRGIGIPKTVDNDLYGTDHTPGFASAARYMALSVKQAGVLARDMQKVDQFVIFQCIGRDAGWLVAATALAKQNEDDAPHILCMPERDFDKEKFLADVEKAYKKYGWVSVVCGEGITYADGTPVSASETKDKFNNVEFGAMGGTSVAVQLHKMISEKFGWRGEFQITESLPMSAADRAAQLDIDEAFMAGENAVRLAEQGQSGVMVSLERVPGDTYDCTTGTAPLSEVAVRAKPMPDEFINDEGNFITDAFIEYAKPLLGEMPDYVRLACHKVK
ncbi:6-phosphofructokinase 1 [Anaerohalosphaera lusitana]|uniref:Pyrophosphate--fructose 6-phosphate 1-phosphotransferase n=1 Tax=Anaerohalosphaera lusitana TaxID=1936003 RepID=A0A1U9NMP6_9BACT|nr:6-phosphofructokinase [Anaerohalosphaera lusitana]AQT69222.1 6-phosphofructokinase 1 [Anaerohalosphaera lusitana]